MPEVEVVSEQEGEAGWSFQIRLGGDAMLALRLSWADYDLWSNEGGDPPHAVAKAVALFMLSKITPADLPATFDASTARRRFPDADSEIPKLIR